MRAVRTAFLIFGLAAALVAPAVAADKYPSRPVHFIAAFAAGGPVDIVARVMADWFSADLGQQFVVENRAGSGGNIGAAAMINSPPDGYTILFDAPNNAISASLYRSCRSISSATPCRSQESCSSPTSWWCRRRCR
jgi:tripartite-type tricarboxylate transporter receptor subunit TctC